MNATLNHTRSYVFQGKTDASAHGTTFFSVWICDWVEVRYIGQCGAEYKGNIPQTLQCFERKLQLVPELPSKLWGPQGAPEAFSKSCVKKWNVSSPTCHSRGFLSWEIGLQYNVTVSFPPMFFALLQSAKCVSSIHPFPLFKEQFSWSCAGGFVV